MHVFIWYLGSTVVGIAIVFLTITPVDGQDQSRRRVQEVEEVKHGKYNKIGTLLGNLHSDYIRGNRDAATNSPLRTQNNNEVLIEVVGTNHDDETLLETSLQDIGFKKTSCQQFRCAGFLTTDNLLDLNEIDVVKYAYPSLMMTNVGSVESEASQSMFVDLAREKFGVNGTGLTIGVLSDSFNRLGGYSADVATGDLPPDVLVLKEANLTGRVGDEGRAMLQLIHDVAPGAKLAFHTAVDGIPDFAQGIRRLADVAGADVIVDDIRYYSEPFFQDGILAQAVDAVVKQGVAYFSAAGNYGRASWEGSFTSSSILTNSLGEQVYDFGGGDSRQLLSGFPGGELVLILNWDEPSFSANGMVGSSSDLDINIYKPTSELPDYRSVDNNIGRDPIEIVKERIPYTAFELEIVLRSGSPPSFVKWIILGDSPDWIEYGTQSGTSFGHSIAASGAGVGAAEFFYTPGFGMSPAVQRPYSSPGGIPILFDVAGNRLAMPQIRKQPCFVGPDGISNTFFGPGNQFPGTSAAAPNVAAVALLMLEANRKLTPQKLYNILKRTAQDMDDTSTPGSEPGFDFGTGFGFVNALAAVTEAIRPPAVSLPRTPTPTPPPAPTPTPTGQPKTQITFKGMMRNMKREAKGTRM